MIDPMCDIDASSGTEPGPEAAEMGDYNLPVFSVSELSHSLRRPVDSFAHVRVREVSRLTLARSGHMYVTFKDENAVLDGVCWRHRGPLGCSS